MLSIFPSKAWEELSAEVQLKIGSVAIALSCAEDVIRAFPECHRWVGEDLRRKCLAELRQHVTEAGICEVFPFCWSFLSDEEREAL